MRSFVVNAFCFCSKTYVFTVSNPWKLLSVKSYEIVPRNLYRYSKLSIVTA